MSGSDHLHHGDGRVSSPATDSWHRYLDELVDDYVSWREACQLVWSAYRNWTAVGRSEQTVAFSEYIAALNCEDEAAAAYQRAVERVAATRAQPV